MLNTKVFGACLVVAVILVSLSAVVHADQRVLLKRGDASPELMRLAHEAFDADFQSTANIFPEKNIEHDVLKGMADINGDGVAEAILVSEWSCGSAGCGLRVLQRRDDKWVTILDGNGDKYFLILDRRDQGYNRICASFLNMWNGERYDEVYPSAWAKDVDRPFKCGEPGVIARMRKTSKFKEVKLALNAGPAVDGAVRDYVSKQNKTVVKLENFAPDADKSIPLSVDREIEKGSADLNGDGVGEVFFMIKKPAYCGMWGCKIFVLQKEGGEWRTLIDDYGYYFRVLNQSDDGHHRLCTGDLWMWQEDGYKRVFATEHDEVNLIPTKCG